MQLGLIGKSLTHSFSKSYFQKKFKALGLQGYSYENYEVDKVSQLSEILKKQPGIKGLNVTIPFKSAMISELNSMDPHAIRIGAVNTIVCTTDGLRGYNTDWQAFAESIEGLGTAKMQQALILGTGGASLAIKYALDQLHISHQSVSRHPNQEQLSYAAASKRLREFQLIVNCTPLGTYPKTNEMPPLKLDHVSENHLFYDLVYNPAKTELLRQVEMRQAQIKNGQEMLERQADLSWEIWHQNNY